MARKLVNAWKGLKELGWEQMLLYGAYQGGLRTGLWRRLSPVGAKPHASCAFHPVLPLPQVDQLRSALGSAVGEVLAEVGEIRRGEVRLFGGLPYALNLEPPRSGKHWTQADMPDLAGDIKFLWEPARFGFAYTLAQAYHLTADEKIANTFWRYAYEFWQHNPPNQGPNWASGQEVGLRLMALAFALHVIPGSAHQMNRMSTLLAEHAGRIPLTLLYARSQNNNHLLTEAAALYTAGLVLPDHPKAGYWRKLGWKWINRGLQRQIDHDGTYAQHSMNYHRLMMHTALWVDALARAAGDSWPKQTREKLAAAARWMIARLDPPSGKVPNLGNNDGANILPLGWGDFNDYRPVAQAAARAFLGAACLPDGQWDVLSVWLGLKREGEGRLELPLHSPGMHRLGTPEQWASLRAVHFRSRPAHADQLHVDLWWRGLNLLRDPGTFMYNGEPPWQNGLATTRVHNTVMVDDRDQMTRAGRFLWLDWAQARLISAESEPGRCLIAEHDGYRALGITHRRKLELVEPNHWLVEDQISSLPNQSSGEHSAVLHWLMPDAPWTLDGSNFTLQTELGEVILDVSGEDLAEVQIIRAGEVLAGPALNASIYGWRCPTYGWKLPALSLRVTFRGALPLVFQTKIELRPVEKIF